MFSTIRSRNFLRNGFGEITRKLLLVDEHRILVFIVRTIYSWIFVLCSAFLYDVLSFGPRFTGFCLPL